jgi:uncharacterized protein (DUF885 family)
VAAVLCGCGDAPEKPFAQLAEEFVYTSLANSPVAATQYGYHQHGSVRLDGILDDYSPAAIEQQRRWYSDFRVRLHRSVDLRRLSAEDRADFGIISDQIALVLLELNDIQSWRHNPTLYVELVGNGLYAPYVLEYADPDTRYEHIIGRLQGVPALLGQARRNLESAPEIWRQVAVRENEGNIGLIELTLRDRCPRALLARFDQAARPAVASLKEFNGWLETRLNRRARDWRLGAANYTKKFRYVLGTDEPPAQVMAAAEQEMIRTRRAMYAIAGKIAPGPGDENTVIRRALDAVAGKHSTAATYFSDARRDLAEAREFVALRQLLTLPPHDNLQVIETPEFMRGIYAVGGFNPAPALEPHLGAFYWLTPIPADWPAERVESKLREYNYYGLKLLTLHEAVPGHYVQLEYSNRIQPPLRRTLRAVFANGPYVEGWAVYATEMMLDEGYLDHDPALRLTFLKQQLRVFANAILDVRLHTAGMTDMEAVDLMVTQAFQEREEAEAKLRRAKLSSAQLPTYFAGWRDWHRVRRRIEERVGAALRLKDFHDRALEAGAVPLPVLSHLLSGKAL